MTCHRHIITIIALIFLSLSYNHAGQGGSYLKQTPAQSSETSSNSDDWVVAPPTGDFRQEESRSPSPCPLLTHIDEIATKIALSSDHDAPSLLKSEIYGLFSEKAMQDILTVVKKRFAQNLDSLTVSHVLPPSPRLWWTGRHAHDYAQATSHRQDERISQQAQQVSLESLLKAYSDTLLCNFADVTQKELPTVMSALNDTDKQEDQIKIWSPLRKKVDENFAQLCKEMERDIELKDFEAVANGIDTITKNLLQQFYNNRRLSAPRPPPQKALSPDADDTLQNLKRLTQSMVPASSSPLTQTAVVFPIPRHPQSRASQIPKDVALNRLGISAPTQTLPPACVQELRDLCTLGEVQDIIRDEPIATFAQLHTQALQQKILNAKLTGKLPNLLKLFAENGAQWSELILMCNVLFYDALTEHLTERILLLEYQAQINICIQLWTYAILLTTNIISSQQQYEK